MKNVNIFILSVVELCISIVFIFGSRVGDLDGAGARNYICNSLDTILHYLFIASFMVCISLFFLFLFISLSLSPRCSLDIILFSNLVYISYSRCNIPFLVDCMHCSHAPWRYVITRNRPLAHTHTLSMTSPHVTSLFYLSLINKYHYSHQLWRW